MPDIALIDGDVVAHHASVYWEALAEQRGVNLVYLDENGQKIQPDLPEWFIEDFKDISYNHFKKKIKEIEEKVWVNESKVAVGFRQNFRKIYYPDYKEHRHKKTTKQNPFVLPIKQRAIQEGIVECNPKLEADDLLRIWAEELRGTKEHVICSIDKDLKCIPGLFYDLKHERLETIDNTKALRIFYQQLLSGDPVDNIPGLPGIGPKTAISLLADYDTEEDFQEVVLGSYINEYQGDWKEKLIFNGILLYLLKSVDDQFCIDHWPAVQELEDLC